MPHVKKDLITFFVTTECNLRCRYCYTGGSAKPQTLDLRFARLGLEGFFRERSSRHIRFFGPGEPTLKIDLIDEIWRNAVSLGGSNVVTEIQTNGVMSDEAVAWLAEHGDIVWVSCDGMPEIHDHYRCTHTGEPTSKAVESTIRQLVKAGRGMIGVRSTITSRSEARQREIVEYVSNLGVENIWTDPIFPSIGKKTVMDKVDMMRYAEGFLDASAFAADRGMFYGSILTCNFDEQTDFHCRACIPVPHLTPDGYISACDMAALGEEDGPMSVFIYGKWLPYENKIEFFDDRIAALRKRSVNIMSGCRGCPAKFNCGGYCLGEVVNESGTLYGQKPAVCDAIRYLNERLPVSLRKYTYLHP